MNKPKVADETETTDVAAIWILRSGGCYVTLLVMSWWLFTRVCLAALFFTLPSRGSNQSDFCCVASSRVGIAACTTSAKTFLILP